GSGKKYKRCCDKITL
ncbi:MAG: SEC-C domain-containing protein, partial [Oscillospiraceae bacterium]|nr:SEC-C domain-containing protein [Oscillospiraceae bacterium]